MSIDKPERETKVDQVDLALAVSELDRHVRRLRRRLDLLAPINDIPGVRPKAHWATFATMDNDAIRSLVVQIGVLLSQAQKARSVEDQARLELRAEKARHEAEVSEIRAQLSACRSALEQAQGENAKLRQENEDLSDELREARQELGDNEFEILDLRRRLALPKQPSLSDLN